MTRQCPCLLPPTLVVLVIVVVFDASFLLPAVATVNAGSSPLLVATPGASNGTELAVAMVALTVFRKDIFWALFGRFHVYPGTNDVFT
jgi:hypothetical protein